jgi:hypothetical protein
MPPVASRHLGEWLGREPAYEAAEVGAGAREALGEERRSRWGWSSSHP